MTTTDPSTNSSAAPAAGEGAASTRLDAVAAEPGVVTGRPLAWLRVEGLAVAGAIGLFHLGLDRLTAYGLKYDHGFGATHLGVHGRR